jgi:mannosyltransferase OCH1-like enzyme
MIDLFTTHKPSFLECPIGLKTNLREWENKNPSLYFKYYDDDEMHRWMRTYTSPSVFGCLELLNTGAGRADLFRICRMNVEGGIWVDADLPAFDILKAKMDLIDLIHARKTVFIKNSTRLNPRYMVMASKPQSKILDMLISRIVDNIKEGKQTAETVEITGPHALHKLLCEVLKLSHISELKTNDANETMFVYIEDIVPLNSPIHYNSYRQELKSMGLQHHYKTKALI